MNHAAIREIRLPHCSCVLLLLFSWKLVAAECRFQIVDGSSEEPIAARVQLLNQRGEPQQAPGLPFWAGHFVCDGGFSLPMPDGTYRYNVEHGPEFTRATGTFTLGANQSTNLIIRLDRIASLANEGWWSGETHVHRNPGEAEILMRAEDLHAAHFITWWNERNLHSGKQLPSVPVLFDSNRSFHPLAGEDERAGGALLYLDLAQPLEISKAERHYPSSLFFAQNARAAGARWIDAEKPFWLDFPLWVAHGVVDTVGIAHNHMQHAGVLDNEAWGLSRDRAKYPGPYGNGLWTQDIYYHLLNCGIRLPPSAGSASGVLPNPVGYNRAYVHLGNGFNHSAWSAGLRAGRSFVSNGPLLRCRANNQLPGHVFESDGPVQIQIEGRLDSRDFIRRIEVVENGRIRQVTLPTTLTFDSSGWFLVRAIADVTNTFRFASTAPWYVQIGGKPQRIRRESAQFFNQWCRDRLEAIAGLRLAEGRKADLLEGWRSAAAFWKDKLDSAPELLRVTARVVDDTTGKLTPSRIYVESADGTALFPMIRANDASGTPRVVPYAKRNWINARATEFHATLTANEFTIELEPGTYTITVEHGTEYRPLHRQITVAHDSLDHTFRLQRWVNMAEQNWFSGDTHVHRTIEDLRNVILAEDLNVAFPMSYWVTHAFHSPQSGDKTTRNPGPGSLISVDPTHVIWPRNTEWEIFHVGGKRHTLGAVFALGHRNAFTNGAPPLKPIAAAAREAGALLDLDKHDWPWSIALVPVMNIDLYELANNHVWRTEFGFTNWSTPAPEYMQLPNKGRSGTERDWLEYTHRTYWALLNCGLRLRPTAGTANGVHPVPLGFGRVYVHLPDGFTWEAWLAGLNAGHSFVTTGPMLIPRISATEVAGSILSQKPVAEVEVIINGEIREVVPLLPRQNSAGAWEASFSRPLSLIGTSWVALRCWEQRASGRERFAHTAPHWFNDPKQPLRARKVEAAYLVDRVRSEIARSASILPSAAMKEYHSALALYEEVLAKAK